MGDNKNLEKFLKLIDSESVFKKFFRSYFNYEAFISTFYSNFRKVSNSDKFIKHSFDLLFSLLITTFFAYDEYD